MLAQQSADSIVRKSVLSALVLVLIPIAVFTVEQLGNYSFANYGLLPRDIIGLRGILFMPFLHADWSHLLSNMSALFILTALGLYTFKRLFWGVIGFVWFAAGFWTWIFARPDYHIGASGIVYGLATFCLLAGFLNKNRTLQGLTLLTVFLYGSFLWGVFPWEYTRDISWEGHLAGAVAGLIMAFLFRKEMPQAPVYNWEDDPEPNPENEEDAYWKLPPNPPKDEHFPS